MTAAPTFASIGKPTAKINVRLSYRIVELFSEGLYASPSKAIEELVANSFDAGAQSVHVILSPELTSQDATIVVIDDGEGMGIEGLRQHWLIGISNKRNLQGKLPRGRQQIGRFGIGKLATYVLAERLTHITKKEGRFFSASMDYRAIDRQENQEVEPKKPIAIQLRELDEAEAKQAVSAWSESTAFKQTGQRLFGKNAPSSWTVSVMSGLKPKALEIRRGTLEWVLRTALPLRDDFTIWYDGRRLTSSKHEKGLIRTWILGKDIDKLPRPAISASPLRDTNLSESDHNHYGLDIPELGRVTGYAEAYKDSLGGKSDEIGRSYGFFVYIFGRLINVDDGHFGIDPNELRHGTFGRFRLVININGLDSELRANRETVREGTPYETAKNVLRAIFNFVRPTIDRNASDEPPGGRLARKLAGTPASLSKTPIVELTRQVVRGKSQSRYLIVPVLDSEDEKEKFLAELDERASSSASSFLAGIKIDNNEPPEAGIARFHTGTGIIHLNGWHPFVITFHEEFANKKAGQPLELIAFAEVAAEAHLHTIGVRQDLINDFLSLRDQLLRTLANESGRQSPMAVARALEEARNNPGMLELKVCAAFTSLGFDCRPIGGKGRADGIATAALSADSRGTPRRYSVTLEAKSKKKDSGKVAASTVDIAAVIRHRNQGNCEHALVIGRDFPVSDASSALLEHIEDDRTKTKAEGTPKTITLITIDDLAELVRLRPLKQIGLQSLRDLFQCRSTAESKDWIATIRAKIVTRPPYRLIVETIAAQAKQFQKNAVKFSALRVALVTTDPKAHYETDEELAELCKAMAQMSNGTMSTTSDAVELDQSPANVLSEIDMATRELEVHDG